MSNKIDKTNIKNNNNNNNDDQYQNKNTINLSNKRKKLQNK